ncbi:coronin-like protein Crn1 [Penicillium chermesinum]|uniref:Coronin n=1 Tax=Penicillium chermesinum TaxID=63820 RepID=A0A9W9TIJ3_9EURO|nr:coronin-like protein Crn1 [Penicillium chermesinum]KAJ5223983.1 coronin-like protein Crn1 [Penicillium chermesinum]
MSGRFDQCYDNLRVSRNAWDTNLLKVNPKNLAVNWESGGGGAFAVIPLEERGKLPDRIPLFRGHTAVVLDTDWNPFNDDLIASGSDDGKVFLWRVPEGFTVRPDVEADDIQDIAPVGKLSGHPKKVGHVLFNPAAENVLATASGDYTVKLWDVEAGASKLSLDVGDIVQSLSWSANGSLLVTTSRDKKLRIWDVRQERPAHESQGHSGAKNSRAVWLGERDRVATTGFSKMSDRQLALWDIRAAREPINGFKTLDSISGVCMPFWDDDTSVLYLAGRGDGNIRYFELENDKFEFLSEYKSADPQRGVAFMPKRGVNMHENELTRAFKTVNDSYVEPISFIVPRRAETFQDDIYPPTIGATPAMNSSEWFSGKEAIPGKISMASLYDGQGLKEVTGAVDKPTGSLDTPSPKPAEPEVKKAEPTIVKPTPREPVSEPTPAARPAPSMKDQGGFDGRDASRRFLSPLSVRHVPPRSHLPPGSAALCVQRKSLPLLPPLPLLLLLLLPLPLLLLPLPVSASTGGSSNVSRDIEEIKNLIAAQTKTIADQAQQMQALTSELESLRSKLN